MESATAAVGVVAVPRLVVRVNESCFPVPWLNAGTGSRIPRIIPSFHRREILKRSPRVHGGTPGTTSGDRRADDPHASVRAAGDGLGAWGCTNQKRRIRMHSRGRTPVTAASQLGGSTEGLHIGGPAAGRRA